MDTNAAPPRLHRTIRLDKWKVGEAMALESGDSVTVVDYNLTTGWGFYIHYDGSEMKRITERHGNTVVSTVVDLPPALDIEESSDTVVAHMTAFSGPSRIEGCICRCGRCC